MREKGTKDIWTEGSKDGCIGMDGRGEGGTEGGYIWSKAVMEGEEGDLGMLWTPRLPVEHFMAVSCVCICTCMF
jgi:hypothetical protein